MTKAFDHHFDEMFPDVMVWVERNGCDGTSVVTLRCDLLAVDPQASHETEPASKKSFAN